MKLCPSHGKNHKYDKLRHPFPPKGCCERCWYEYARFIPLHEVKNGNKNEVAE